ncbi:Methionine synthase [bioreactor metagenome]|uniref:Methionine synthase n=1 Tax=bioreactor metagenome TaxID=1076179 RepID=A0A645GU17_9ZZZZ
MENLEQLHEAILTGNLKQAVEVTTQAIAQGVDPQLLISDYMSKAMEEIGGRFEAGKAFVPELLMSARAMKGALEIIKPILSAKGSTTNLGKVVIGTVKGDLHDIGKNLVASMLEGCGFEVINLGVDISSEKFVEAVRENKANIICMSALLTTTMTYMKEVIGALEKSGLRDEVKVMIGGAPINQNYASEIGADGYSSNANAAVVLAKQLLEK